MQYSVKKICNLGIDNNFVGEILILLMSNLISKIIKYPMNQMNN